MRNTPPGRTLTTWRCRSIVPGNAVPPHTTSGWVSSAEHRLPAQGACLGLTGESPPQETVQSTCCYNWVSISPTKGFWHDSPLYTRGICIVPTLSRITKPLLEVYRHPSASSKTKCIQVEILKKDRKAVLPAARRDWMVSSQGLGKWPRKCELKILSGNSLVVQGSGLGSFHCGRLGSIRGRGTKILQATRCGRGKKKRDFHSLKMNLRTMNLWKSWLFFPL